MYATFKLRNSALDHDNQRDIDEDANQRDTQSEEELRVCHHYRVKKEKRQASCDTWREMKRTYSASEPSPVSSDSPPVY